MSRRWTVHHMDQTTDAVLIGTLLNECDEEIEATQFAVAFTGREIVATVILDHERHLAWKAEHAGEWVRVSELTWSEEISENPEPRFPRATEIQTLIFDRSLFDRPTAKRWAEDHDFRYGDRHIHGTEKSVRIRQRDPDDFEPWTFRTIELTDGIKAVIGMPRA